MRYTVPDIVVAKATWGDAKKKDFTFLELTPGTGSPRTSPRC